MDIAADPLSHILPGSGEESAVFARLQASLEQQFREVFPDPMAPRCVVIVPSLSLDREVLAKISGVHHYEERMLCMLLLLRLPRTRVIYMSSKPIPDSIVDYCLHLLPGVPPQHSRNRLTLLSCHDASDEPLTSKILARPRLIERLRAAVGDCSRAHMACFNVSALERSLAVQLGIPIYGCDPELLPLGSKSGGRRLFRAAGVAIPEGAEDLTDARQVAEALADLKARDPALRRAVVKLNEGFSGEGNSLFRFDGAPEIGGLTAWVRERLPDLSFEAQDMTWELFSQKLGEMGGVVEAFVEGRDKRSPSAQYRVDPLGGLEVISTHDQLLGGGGQIFLGCRFPADEAYRLEVQAEGLKAAQALRDQGVLGRFGIDFVSVPRDQGWRHYAIEVNLRKGGTTHPFLMLQFLTDGGYDPESGLFHSHTGRPCFYVASDNLESPRYRGLAPDDLIDIAACHGLHFHSAAQEGVVFHLIGALSEFGKLGLVSVAGSHERAQQLYDDTVAVLDRQAGSVARGQ